MAERPDPDRLLKQVQAEENETRTGRLKLFFGATPGVGKTYSMLEAAQQRKKQGVDVVVGLVETHSRADTAVLLAGLEILPRKKLTHKGIELQEFDLDAALIRKPSLILVDELAHTNATGSRHAKRWQDVQELLDAGIDVYTALNVQHWESLNDVVAAITGVRIQETVPDTFLKKAFALELVDLPPDELLTRLKEGKVYHGETAERAAEHFFKPGNLIALRELALRHAAERVDAQMQAFQDTHTGDEIWPMGERLLVGLSASPMSPRLVRATKRLATRLRAPWVALYIETPDISTEDRVRVAETLALAEDLGGETLTLAGLDPSADLLRYAREHHITRIILGKPARPRWREWLFGSIVNEVARRAGHIDLYVISGVGADLKSRRPVVEKISHRREIAMGILIPLLSTLVCWPLAKPLDRTNLVMIYLVGIAAVAYRWGRVASTIASVASVLAFDFCFVPPYFSFAISDTQYVITFAVMLAVGLLIGTLTGRLRYQADAMRRHVERTQLLYQFSRRLSETPNPRNLLRTAWTQLEAFCKSPVVILCPDNHQRLSLVEGDESFASQGNEIKTAEWVFGNGRPAGLTTDTLAGSIGFYIPMKGLRGTVGVLGIQPREVALIKDPDYRRLLESLAGEIGGALESTQMSEAAGQAEAQVQSERARTLILSSFSNDLHDPLTTISLLCDQFLSSSPPLPESLRLAAKRIRSEAAQIDKLATDLPAWLEDKRPTSLSKIT